MNIIDTRKRRRIDRQKYKEKKILNVHFIICIKIVRFVFY